MFDNLETNCNKYFTAAMLMSLGQDLQRALGSFKSEAIVLEQTWTEYPLQVEGKSLLREDDFK